MSQRSQIEWLKFSRLRNKPLITCTDQCEYYCFHILRSFFFRLTPSVVGPLRDNHHFLFPITKSDVCNKLEKVWPKGSRKAACSIFWNVSKRGLTACVRTATGVLRKRLRPCENSRKPQSSSLFSRTYENLSMTYKRR